jgi:hypothetical protein
MSVHAAKLGSLFDVPDLHLTGAQANANISAVTTPFDTTDISIRRCLQQAADCPGIGRPDVYIPLQTDGDLVTRTPIKKVEIVVVEKARSI